jgi:hypothetical protein
MQYLVLQQFRSLGKTFVKGTVIDGREIRSPRLRQSEGKIIPAVSSFTVPAESVSEGQASQDGFKEEDKIPVAPEEPSKKSGLKLSLNK